MPTIFRTIAFVSGLAGAAAPALTASLPQRATAHSDEHGHSHAHTQGFAAGEPGDPKKANRIVEIVMTDGPGTMSYSPDRVEVRRGEQVKFVLRNIGDLPHEFVIDSIENNARHKIEMEKSPDRASPGKSAAANSVPTDCPRMSASRIRMVLGGMIWPRVPDAQMVPQAVGR